jgi:hypothetical protein
MKIHLNLSPSQSLRQRHVLAWSLPLLAISIALLIRLGFSIQTNWTEYRSVSRSVQREQDRRNVLAAREAGLKMQLDEPDNRALLREVQFVNSVIDQRQFSFTEMEARVTALLPPEVRLTALSMPDNAGEPLIHVGVEGSSEGPVETFLINLEDSQDFKDTMITGAGFDEKGNGSPVGISCTAHYVTGHSAGGIAKAGGGKQTPKRVWSRRRRRAPPPRNSQPLRGWQRDWLRREQTPACLSGSERQKCPRFKTARAQSQPTRVRRWRQRLPGMAQAAPFQQVQHRSETDEAQT